MFLESGDTNPFRTADADDDADEVHISMYGTTVFMNNALQGIRSNRNYFWQLDYVTDVCQLEVFNRRTPTTREAKRRRMTLVSACPGPSDLQDRAASSSLTLSPGPGPAPVFLTPAPAPAATPAILTPAPASTVTPTPGASVQAVEVEPVRQEEVQTPAVAVQPDVDEGSRRVPSSTEQVAPSAPTKDMDIEVDYDPDPGAPGTSIALADDDMDFDMPDWDTLVSYAIEVALDTAQWLSSQMRVLATRSRPWLMRCRQVRVGLTTLRTRRMLCSASPPFAARSNCSELWPSILSLYGLGAI